MQRMGENQRPRGLPGMAAAGAKSAVSECILIGAKCGLAVSFFVINSGVTGGAEGGRCPRVQQARGRKTVQSPYILDPQL